MRRKQQAAFIPWRFYFTIGLISVAVIGLICRVYFLSIMDQPFLQKQGDERALRLVKSPAFRGMIVDRNGYPLAVSTTVDAVWVNPQEFVPTATDYANLGKLLEMKPESIKQLYLRYKKRHREFLYLKRGVNPDTAKSISELGLPGVYIQEEYRRFYPEGEIAAHVVGFTNIDDNGQEGLELGYNDWLKGEPGKKWVIKDRLGRTVSILKTEKDQKPGSDLTTSLDRRIQYLAYRELMQAVIANKAESGSAVVLDVKTGEVLAMVNQPGFNPNKHDAVNASVYRNRAVTDVFEPGSTIKAFSIASALDSGLFKPDTRINTFPGWMRVGRNVVKDGRNHGELSVREILQMSSNVGVTKMVLGMQPDQLWSMLHRVGFGELSGIGFPGEQAGMLVKHEPWGSFTLATLGFGYGMSATALQLARAYTIIANHGVKLPVSLLKVEKFPSGEQVMRPAVADQMLNLLESVLAKGGTGTKARVPGYRVAGKTGTSLIAADGGYKKHRYIANFVGIAPASNPRLVVAVVVIDPRGKSYYGGSVAGPAFERIMEGALRFLSVPPDSDKE